MGGKAWQGVENYWKRRERNFYKADSITTRYKRRNNDKKGRIKWGCERGFRRGNRKIKKVKINEDKLGYEGLKRRWTRKILRKSKQLMSMLREKRENVNIYEVN